MILNENTLWKFPPPTTTRNYDAKFVILLSAAKVIKINKNLIGKKRGECAKFRAEHYFPINGSHRFTWKKRHTTTIHSNDRISILNDGKELVIKHLTEADTALYSSEVETTGGREITQYWLVVRGMFFLLSFVYKM